MRRIILAAGLLLAIFGLAAMGNGWTIVQIERGWAQLIAGSVLLGSGALLAALSVAIARLDALLAIAGPVTGYAGVPADAPDVAPHEPIPVPAAMPMADHGKERPHEDAPQPSAMPLETFRPPVSIEAVAPPIDEAEERPAVSPDNRIPIGVLAGAATAAGATMAATLRPSDMPPAPSDTPPPLPVSPPPPSSLPPPPFMTRPLPSSYNPPSFTPPPLPTAQGSPETRRAVADFEERLFGTPSTAKAIAPPVPASQPEFHVAAPSGSIDDVGKDVHEAPPAVESDFYAEPEETPPALGPVGDAQFTEELEDIRHAPADSEPIAEPEPEPEPEPAPEIDEMAWLDAALRGVEMPKEPEWAAKPFAAEPVNPLPPPPLPPRAVAPPPLPPLPPQPLPHEPSEQLHAESIAPHSEEQPEPAPHGNIVRTYESQGVIYSLYDNGSVDAETPNGLFHFNSVDELREFLAKSA